MFRRGFNLSGNEKREKKHFLQRDKRAFLITKGNLVFSTSDTECCW